MLAIIKVALSTSIKGLMPTVLRLLKLVFIPNPARAATRQYFDIKLR